jgi:hypothetical protein
MEFQGRHAHQAHSVAGEADFLKTGVIALYYSLINMAMTVQATRDGLPWATGI